MLGLCLEGCLSWLIAIVLILVVSAYLYFTWNFNYWAKRGVAYVPPTFFFGTLKPLIFRELDAANFIKYLYTKFPGEPLVGIFRLNKPALVINSPELMRLIMVKDFDHFVDRNFHPDEKVDPFGAKNIFSMTGTKWKHMRTKLTPTFTSGKIKGMLQLVLSTAEELSEYVDTPASTNEPVEVKEMSAKYTTDTIAISAFGIKGNALKNPDAEFRVAGKKIFEPSYIGLLVQTALFFCPEAVKLLKLRFYPQETVDFFRSVIQNTMKYREDNNIVGKDFLQMLIGLKNEGKVESDEGERTNQKTGLNEKFDDDDILGQAMVFFEAGFETASNIIAFAFYELAMNPNCQKLLGEDIDSVLQRHDGKVTYEAIQEMGYLDKVVSETLRKYPVAPMLDRVCTKPYVIPERNIKIPKGMSIYIPVAGLHYDPRYYPKPDVFDPERFSEEMKRSRTNYTYIPFGDGPRNCIGMRFALVQVKAALIYIFRKYNVASCEKTQTTMEYEHNTLLVTPKDGIWLKFKHRNITSL